MIDCFLKLLKINNLFFYLLIKRVCVCVCVCVCVDKY